MVRARGDTSPDGLHDDAPQVTPDEDPGVPLRLQATVLWPTIQDDMFQRQIDARGKEAGGQHEAADLGFEARVGPGVVPHDEAADVASHFAEDAEPDGEHVRPCAGVGADEELGEEEEAEEGGEEGVDGEVGEVAVEGA